MDHITIVAWCHLVNDIDLCRSPKSNRQKIHKPLFCHSTSFNVIEFGANWEPVYNFLLVINSNLDLISHRYWDTATYWPKIGNFAYPPLIQHLRSGWPPLNLWKSLTVPETSLPGSRRWRFCDPSLHCFRLIHSCDRWTDRQTELWWLRHAESSSCFRT